MPHNSQRFAILVGLFRLTVLLGLLAACAPGLAYAGSISGVCPDGSMFIVQHRSAIPCKRAKEVEPENIPPMKPEFLPRPYGWESFNRETDPNNPYNLVDTELPSAGARPAPSRGTARAEPETRQAPPVQAATPQVAIASPRRAAAAPPVPAAFSESDLADLAAIIVAKQRIAPATLHRPGAASARGLELRLAHSRALEARVHEGASGAHGPVVVFHVLATDAGAFWGNLTFVQGHIAHHPDPADASQFQLLAGKLGALAGGDGVLGYTVLPPHLDPSQPMDVYWDDHQLTTTLAPSS